MAPGAVNVANVSVYDPNAPTKPSSQLQEAEVQDGNSTASRGTALDGVDPASEEEVSCSEEEADDDCSDDYLFCDASSDFEHHDDFGSASSRNADDGDEPLYPGSDISFSEAMIAILTFVMCQKLSKECLGQLLGLLKLLLPKNNVLVESCFLFYSYFDKYVSMNHVKHFYCNVCTEALLTQDAVCPRCGSRKRNNFFLNFSITDQLRSLLSKPGFYEKLSYPQNRVKKDANAYEDIYDGNIYKEAQQSFFNVGKWISFMWNTDGFSIFQSSTFSVWPFYLSVNELPPHLRMKKEHMVLGGLWFGTGKFDPNLFLKPIHDELLTLRRGIYFKVHSFNESILFQVAMLCGTCDAPGKSSFFRHIQFNGLFGCMKCLTRGLKSAASGNVFVYPFEEQLPLRSEGTLSRHLNYLKDNPGAKVRFGVKGPSYLHRMLLLSSVRSTSIDIMHCVFLGVQKSMLDLLFGKKYKGAEFSLSSCLNVVNEYLENIKPPHFLQRCPQPLSKLAFWKASEYQSFFFFYSLPIFSTIMDPVYFHHFLNFYQGVYLLCQDSVTAGDIQMSQLLLDNFVKRFQQLYGLRHMTFNLHCLRHLPSVVEELGPLWTSTCFLFEDLNGTLKHLVHGTQHIGLQVQSNFGLVTRLPYLIKACNKETLKNYCLQMYYPVKRLKVTFSIDYLTHVIGIVSKASTLAPVHQQCINRFPGNVSYFKRLKKNSTLFVSMSEKEGKKLSSYVFYNSNGNEYHGILQTFFKVSQCNCTDALCACPTLFYALLLRVNTVKPLQTLSPETVIDSVFQYTVSGNVDVIPVTDLTDTCVQVAFADKQYIVIRPTRQNTQ
ncbi:Putative F-box protein [Frankliniella fusca]|uniref:F-box protein n=1 Tax=Frankliniella fusca TaxID=407009 RepID=A0AAE1HBD5_9NEOP|nr:Putative F-box protein [Frankliniella fusca]